MTTWSVVKDDTREKRLQDLFPRSLPRWALLACLALVVVSLGVAVTAVRPPDPAEPPFSEQARAAALTETLRLRAAGEQLGRAAPGTAPDPGQAAAGQTVTLLTTQARALLAPGDDTPEASARAATPLLSSTALPTPAPLPSSAAGLVAALAESGGQRLAAAAVADGGMARLLTAVGTAQLLQASALAAATGTAAPPAADVASPQLSGACPSGSAAASPSPSPGGDSPSGAASLEAALAATVRTEAESVYAYQVALPRLGGDAAKAASEQLARHEGLLNGAEALSRTHCSPVPPRDAGYTLGKSFLAAPASGLADLETATLPVYGDLVALSEGETRQWAIYALLGAARRAVFWGADPGAIPGLAADPASFPALPATGSPSPSPTGS
ncbi:DUF4439 domain-containing protein [Pseudarthrobacter sp. S9]|uniref:DUF4439 domain-containing protein n=1 Tax=Pseudarthrobacter sp. S9 TaxID=3418421 RepID=UPI003CFF2504